MTNQEISEFIKGEISPISNLPVSEIKDDQSLLYDCLLDDVDIVDIILSVEELTGKQIPDHYDYIRAKENTVGQFIRWILKQLQ